VGEQTEHNRQPQASFAGESHASVGLAHVAPICSNARTAVPSAAPLARPGCAHVSRPHLGMDVQALSKPGRDRSPALIANAKVLPSLRLPPPSPLPDRRPLRKRSSGRRHRSANGNRDLARLHLGQHRLTLPEPERRRRSSTTGRGKSSDPLRVAFISCANTCGNPLLTKTPARVLIRAQAWAPTLSRGLSVAGAQELQHRS